MSSIPSMRIVRPTLNYAEVREFYESGLDMRPLEEWDRGGDDRGVVLVFNGPTSATSIEVLTYPGFVESAHPVGGDPPALTLAVEVANVGAQYEKIRANGIEISRELANMPWGHRTFAVRDPDGFQVTFFQDMTRKEE